MKRLSDKYLNKGQVEKNHGLKYYESFIIQFEEILEGLLSALFRANILNYLLPSRFLKILILKCCLNENETFAF